MPIVEMCDECNARAGTCNCYDWEETKDYKDVTKPFSNICQICEEYVKSVYTNSTGKTGHKRCV